MFAIVKKRIDYFLFYFIFCKFIRSTLEIKISVCVYIFFIDLENKNKNKSLNLRLFFFKYVDQTSI